MVLSASEAGRTRLRVIPKGALTEVKLKVARYQQLRRGRTRLGEIYKKMLAVIDQMEALRREDMTPEPPAESRRPASARTRRTGKPKIP